MTQDTVGLLPPIPRGPDLPVRECLPRLLEALRARGCAVLVAPPGTGKTTLVPLALPAALPPGAGRVVVAEPRRVAARAAAHRMASLLGERVGGRVGLTMRGERVVSAATLVEVVTTGVLVQRLHRDPELSGTAAVVLDECHERHLDADLALALVVDARAGLRPDLLLLATSATLDAEPVARAIGGEGPAPVVTAQGRLFPVAVRWCPPTGPVDPPHGLRVDPRLLDHVAATVRRALEEHAGDALVFLPGAGEISAVARRLEDLPGRGVAVLRLHGRQSVDRQDAALREQAGRRVVLATAVAESSLTVPGVRVVVDAGLCREPRVDLTRGLSGLVTVRVSRAGADQRAGRAGRQGPGAVYRCWSQAEHERLPARARPEIACADLTAFTLALACWGVPDGSGLALLDPPPPAALQAAAGTLRRLGALDAGGRVTPRGRTMAQAGAPPRLARAVIDGAALVGRRRVAEVVALLSEDAAGPADGDDLVARWRALRAGQDGASARWRREVRRLEAGAPSTSRDAGAGVPDDLAAALVVALAFPERVARARRPGSSTYLMAGGTAADLAPGSSLATCPWLAVAAADRQPGTAGARIRLAVPLDEATAREVGRDLLTREEQVRWDGGDVVAHRVERLGAVVLSESPLSAPAPALLAEALCEGLRREGLGLVRWSPEGTALRERLAFCHLHLGVPWPDVTDAALLDRAPEWLGPDLAGVRSRAALGRVDAGTALRRLLPWPEAARLDELAPERVLVPSGSRVRVDYTAPEAPVLAVKLQELFGWRRAPAVAGVDLTVHLLSPAGRPVAVTRDLESFWRTGYPRVRAELRGRYPRHPWPEDPSTAPATRRTARRGG